MHENRLHSHLSWKKCNFFHCIYSLCFYLQEINLIICNSLFQNGPKNGIFGTAHLSSMQSDAKQHTFRACNRMPNSTPFGHAIGCQTAHLSGMQSDAKQHTFRACNRMPNSTAAAFGKHRRQASQHRCGETASNRKPSSQLLHPVQWWSLFRISYRYPQRAACPWIPFREAGAASGWQLR